MVVYTTRDTIKFDGQISLNICVASSFFVAETKIFEFSILEVVSVPNFNFIRQLLILGHFRGQCPFSRGRGSLSVGRLVNFLFSMGLGSFEVIVASILVGIFRF